MRSETKLSNCDSLLSEKEVAVWLNVNPKRLQAWRLRSYGPRFIRVSSRCVRYSFNAVQEWLTKRSLDKAEVENA